MYYVAVYVGVRFWRMEEFLRLLYVPLFLSRKRLERVVKAEEENRNLMFLGKSRFSFNKVKILI